jgi:hypothetical protein
VNWSARIVTRATGSTRAARFAGGVAARHAGDPSAWLRCTVRTAGSARVLLRRRRIVVAGAPVTFAIAPRIELRLVTTDARRAPGIAPVNARAGRVAQEPAPTVSALTAAPMLQRAAWRAARDDAQASDPSARVRRDLSPRPASSADTMPGNAAGLPARVLRRRAPAAAPPPAPVRDEPVVRAAMPPARPAPLSPVEINRLTDHIVQTIDRRIAAFRERQGRV